MTVYICFSTICYKLHHSITSILITERINYAIEHNYAVASIDMPDEYLDTVVAISSLQVPNYVNSAYVSPNCFELIRQLKLTYDYLHLDLAPLKALIDEIELTKYKTAVIDYIEHALMTSNAKLHLAHPFMTADFYRKFADRFDFSTYIDRREIDIPDIYDYPLGELPAEIAIYYFPRSSVYKYAPDVPIELDLCSINTNDIFEYSSDFKNIELLISHNANDYHLLARNKHLPNWFVDKHIDKFLKYVRPMYYSFNTTYLALRILAVNPNLIANCILGTKDIPIDIINKHIDKFNLSLCTGHNASFYHSLKLTTNDHYSMIVHCNELPMDFIASHITSMSYFNPNNKLLTNQFILEYANYIMTDLTDFDYDVLYDWRITDEFAHQLLLRNYDLIHVFMINRWLSADFYNRYLPYDIKHINDKSNANLISMYIHYIVYNNNIDEKIIANYDVCSKHLHLLHVFKLIPLQLYINYNIKHLLERIDTEPPISNVQTLFN
jgi:hypothetical protein